MTRMAKNVFELNLVAMVLLVAAGRLGRQTFDFENGTEGWTLEGTAFEGQPYCNWRMLSTHFAKVRLGGDY